MRWQTLKIKLPEGEAMRAEQARKVLAANIGPEYPQEILHYRDGQPMPGLSPFRFGAYRNSIELHAVGFDAVVLLSQQLAATVDAFSTHFGKALDFSVRQGVYQFRASEKLRPYKIPFLLLQTHSTVHRRIRDDEDAAAEQAQQLIVDGIIRQYELLGIGVNEYDIQVCATKINGNGTGKLVPVEIKPGIYGLVAKNVTFLSNQELAGPWHVGGLASRGFGRISKG